MPPMHLGNTPPALKNGVDIQLQSAFADENWPTVIRLADKRAKASGDPYYEAIKMCAESKLDGVSEKSAAAVAVDLWVRNGTVPADVESLELLEWAYAGTPIPQSYSETLGTLRLRWAKANMKDTKGLISCMRECLLNWDLVNSQQIAAIMDRSSNSHDRRFMYWNILLTHMLSTSLCCPRGKQKIYGILAQKQLEKAAELAAANTASHGRGLWEEEEFLLYYRVVAEHGSVADLLKHSLSSETGAFRQFQLGHKQPYTEVISKLEAEGQWDAVFDLCRQGLQITDFSGTPSTLACDLQIWRSLIRASRKQADVEKAFDEVQEILQSFISAKSEIPRMFTKTVGIALLETIFSLPPSLLSQESENLPSPRVEQLLTYMQANLERASLFGDVKGYIETLSFAESRDLLQRLGALSASGDNKFEFEVQRAVIINKVRYLLATCPQTLWRNLDASGVSTPTCKYCSQPAGPNRCNNCFHNIALSCLETHGKVSKDEGILKRIPHMDKDPRVDLVLVSASCLLKLAGIRKGHGRMGRPRVSFVNGARFLQAAALLQGQIQLTPAEIPLQLLLVRMYVLLGWGSRALRLWNPLGVKRTVLDALGPLFYDRLSTVAPALFLGSKPLTESLRKYYATVLKRESPVKIWDAFFSGSYSSILDMAKFNDNLHHSCTRGMAVLEERRATRAFGGRIEDVEDVSIFAEITSNIDLVDATDYGSMPNLNSSTTSSLAEELSIGPGLAGARIHLGLLSEKLLDLMSHKTPKEYKPLKQAEAAQRERAYLLESLATVESSLLDFLHRPDTPSKLTAAELSYYTIMALLSSAAVLGISANQATAIPHYFADVMSSLTTTYGIARSFTLDQPGSPDAAAEAALCLFTNLHGLSLLRETAVAIKQTAAFLITFHDRETARDRTGKSGLHKNIIAATRTLKTISAQAFTDIKAFIKSAKERMDEPGFQSGFNEWVVHADGSGNTNELSLAVLATAGGKDEVTDWSGELVGGWRETLKGWAMIQLE